MKKLQLAFFLVVILTSCVKDDYSLEATKMTYSPEVAAPLLNASIEVSQIISELDSSLLTENGDKLLEFRFSNDVYSLALSEFINIPNDTIEFKFQTEVINETVVSSLGLTSGEKLNKIELKSGDLIIKVDYGLEEAAKIYIELPYARLDGGDGSIFKDSIPIGPGPTSLNKTLDLTGYTFDLTRGGLDQNSFEAKITSKSESSGSTVNFDTSNSVTAQVIMSEIEPLFIEGYFGSQPLNIASETFDFDLGEAEIFEKISFADPTITLGFHSTFGIPMEISSLDLSMKRENDSSSLNSTSVFPFKIAGSNSRGKSESSELVIGGSTNISELINIWPNEVTTSFSGVINPEGETDKNFALDTSKVDVTLDLSIPVYGTVTNFNISDTIKIDSSMSQIFEFVKRASLRTNVDNGLPLEGMVKFYIADENYVVLDSLECSDGNNVLIDAAVVNSGSGEVITNGLRQADLVADEDDVNLLKIVGNHLILSARLSTANDGNPVKIYSNYSIEIKMGILAKVFYESP